MKRNLTAIALVVTALGLTFALPLETAARMSPDRSHMQTGPVEISLERVTSGKEGHLRTLAIQNLPSGPYVVKVESVAQPISRSGSDIVLKSRQSQVVIHDVEAESFMEETSDDILMVSGGTAHAYVKLGPDGEYSGGLRAILTPEVTAPTFASEFGPVTTGTPVNPDALPKAGGGSTSILVLGIIGLGTLTYILLRRYGAGSPRGVKSTHAKGWSILVVLPFAARDYLVSKTPLTKLYKSVQSLLNATR